MPVVVILKPDNIVFLKIFAILHFNDLERNLAGVFEAVLRRHRYVGAFVRVHIIDILAVGHLRGPGDHDPVLAPVVMKLMGKLRSWIDDQTFNLVMIALFQDRIGAPGPVHCGVDQVLA
jgi:hypothetical protein